MLIFRSEQEHQPPGQDSIEGSIKESRLLNGFANDGCAGQVALECRDKGWCCIYPEDVKSFINQCRRDGKAGPAAEINDAAATQQSSGLRAQNPALFFQQVTDCLSKDQGATGVPYLRFDEGGIDARFVSVGDDDSAMKALTRRGTQERRGKIEIVPTPLFGMRAGYAAKPLTSTPARPMNAGCLSTSRATSPEP